MDSECNCPLCLHLLVRPLNLPCGHVYCTNCLADYFHHQTNHGRATACPLCRTAFVLADPNPLNWPESQYHKSMLDARMAMETETQAEKQTQGQLQLTEGRVEDTRGLKASSPDEIMRTGDDQQMGQDAADEAATSSADRREEKILVEIKDLSTKVACMKEKLERFGGHIGDQLSVQKMTLQKIQVTVKSEFASFREKLEQLEGSLLKKAEDSFKTAYKSVELEHDDVKILLNHIEHTNKIHGEAMHLYEKHQTSTKLALALNSLRSIVNRDANLVPPTIPPFRFEGVQILGYLSHQIAQFKKQVESTNSVSHTGLMAVKKESGVSTAVKAESNTEWGVLQRKSIAPNTPLRTVGGLGTEPSKFGCPFGIARHPTTGNLYVADGTNFRVQVLSPQLDHVSTYGVKGSAAGQFNYPIGIAISPTGIIAISEGRNHRVQLFNDNLTFRQSVGRKGTGPGEFSSPHHLAYDKEGNLYVSESGNERVQMFDAEGKFVRFIVCAQSTVKVSKCEGLMVSEEGQVYVMGHASDKVHVYSKSGDFIRTVDVMGCRDFNTLCWLPGHGFAIGSYNDNQVRIYSKDGTFKKVLSHDHPWGLSYRPDGLLYVVSRDSHTISVYRPFD